MYGGLDPMYIMQLTVTKINFSFTLVIRREKAHNSIVDPYIRLSKEMTGKKKIWK